MTFSKLSGQPLATAAGPTYFEQTSSSSNLPKMASPPAAVVLLGPPEIRLLSSSAASKHDPFLDLVDTGFNVSTPRLPMGLTENLSPTFLSAGDPCLGFFFQNVPRTPAATVSELLSSAWEKDATTALKLVCNLRGVRGTGKSDREGLYSPALWLKRHHPKILPLTSSPFLHPLVADDDGSEKANAPWRKHVSKRRGYDRRRFQFSHCRRSRKQQLTKKRRKDRGRGGKGEGIAGAGGGNSAE